MRRLRLCRMYIRKIPLLENTIFRLRLFYRRGFKTILTTPIVRL